MRIRVGFPESSRNILLPVYSIIPVILGDLYSPIISWDFLFSSSPVSAHDDVSGSKVVSRGCVVTFWTSNGADKVDFCHLKSP
jgi:hypothetical protein